jgi:hypothetical protein
MAEVEVAGPVVDWLKANGWEVWQEVPACGATADLVAKRGGVMMVVETKTTMSLALLGQARRWIGNCHQVCVAVPRRKRDSAAEGAEWICNLTGIGLLYVGKYGVREAVIPKTFEAVSDFRINKELRPEQQDGSIPAGTSTGKAWTPWRVTVTAISKLVNERPGMLMSEVLKEVKTHYRNVPSARRSLTIQALRGMLPGISGVAEGRDVRLWPVGFKT